jgi:EAL and modified HD-GYP domain-containing signal transduction protein
MEHGSRPIGHLAALALMVAVHDPSISIDELADLANADPALAYHLIRLVNASAFGLRDTIESVRHAIVLLGIAHVRQLATVLTMAGSSTDNPELIRLAVGRAHMARHLLANRPEAESAFTAGLLSVIDVVFHAPMSDLVDELPVTAEIRTALLDKPGTIGHVLRLIRAHEQVDLPELRRFGTLGVESVTTAYMRGTDSAAALNEQLGMLTNVASR